MSPRRQLLLMAVGVIVAACLMQCNDAATTIVRRRVNETAAADRPQYARQARPHITVSDADLLENLRVLEGRLVNIERINSERTNQLDAQIRQILAQQSEIERNALDNTQLLHDLSARAQQPASRPDANADQHTVAEKLESLAYLLQSTRRAVHNLNNTVANTLYGVQALLHDLPTVSDVQQLLLDAQPPQAASNVALLTRQQTSFVAPDVAPIGCETIGRTNGSAVYRIRASGGAVDSFYAFCQAAASNSRPLPAWTVILRRSEESTNFYRSWEEYRNGFGNVAGDHWIGLERLHEITASRLHELRIELEDSDGEMRYASYAAFAVAGERQSYALNVLGDYTGTAGDSLTYHAGQKFSTFDADNDLWTEGNCAQAHSGGWWYNACDKANLGGRYLEGNVSAAQLNQGIYWDSFHGPSYSLRRVRMMIRSVV